MPINITIIGLGQIGGSIGLALAGQSQLLTRLGHNHSPEVYREAMKAGAIDRYEINLPHSVDNADLVILALPFDQIHETLEIIAPVLKQGAVVMDTSPLKQPVIQWMQELLPEERYYVGLTPVLNPLYLHEQGSGFSSARADLFHDAVLGIIATQDSPSEAIKLGYDLAKLLQAIPYFSDAVEMDGLMSTVHLLPQLMAASLVNITSNKPGWIDAQKLAGKPYAQVTNGADTDTPEALASIVKSNKINTVRLIDSLIDDLIELKQNILADDQASLTAAFARARKGEAQWWKDRQAFQWANEDMTLGIEAPTMGEVLGRFVGLGKKRSKKNP